MRNIAFFLTPKSSVVYVTPNMTLRQAIEKMENHRYKSISILTEDGGYYGVLTEGDILWLMKRNPDLNFKNTEKIRIEDVPRYWKYDPVSISEDMDSLIRVAEMQSFVPVVDDTGIFIGIIRRSDILNYCYSHMAVPDETSGADKPVPAT